MPNHPAPESIREKIAEWVWIEVYQNTGITWEGVKAQPGTLTRNLVESCYFKADQILALTGNLEQRLKEAEEKMSRMVELDENQDIILISGETAIDFLTRTGGDGFRRIKPEYLTNSKPEIPSEIDGL